MKLTKKYIDDNLFRKDGNLNNRRLIGFSAEEVYLTYYNLQKPICKNCNNTTKFINFRKGYQEFCSYSCSSKFQNKALNAANKILNMTEDEKKLRKEKTKKTCETKYGGVGFASKKLQEKVKDTCKKKYGDEHYNNPEKFQLVY